MERLGAEMVSEREPRAAGAKPTKEVEPVYPEDAGSWDQGTVVLRGQ
jgi:hypothetical protein